MTDDELAEELELHAKHGISAAPALQHEASERIRALSAHVALLKASLAQAEREAEAVASAAPRAWAHFAKNGNIRIWTSADKEAVRIAKENGIELTPLYAAPLAELEKKVRELEAIAEARLRDLNSAGDMLAAAGYADEDQPLWADIANARLVAAAPDLLEFAEEVRRSGDTRLASMAIAVIAKAKEAAHA